MLHANRPPRSPPDSSWCGVRFCKHPDDLERPLLRRLGARLAGASASNCRAWRYT
jgi:hypothetical protein